MPEPYFDEALSCVLREKRFDDVEYYENTAILNEINERKINDYLKTFHAWRGNDFAFSVSGFDIH